ncbi:sulfotransferase family protein [Streptomyces oceani]|uniref:sulfotransferase family protein n=1 Tax=Streptomyces oceani TaxID=1075402 RepID=UPI0008729915|nr:sulfotransferase family protein [Streptomyces oceani]
MPGWVDVMKGETSDWEGIFDGFRSTLDRPAAAYWWELSEAYPTAKVLLTVRDPERWYKSVYDTIYQGVKSGEAPTEDGHEFWGLLQERGPGPWFEDKDRAVRFFEEHNAAVSESIPAERLLVHHVGDGWEPL